MQQHILIDGGSNRPDDLPATLKKLSLPSPDHVYAFEPNSAFWPLYERQPVELVRAALWDSDEVRPFYLSRYEGQQGSSLFPNKLTQVEDRLEASFLPEPLLVQCLATGPWIVRHVPQGAHLTLKLDIEGAEYRVLWHLLKTNVIHRVSSLFVEFHWQKLQVPEIHHRTLVDALLASGHPPRPWPT